MSYPWEPVRRYYARNSARFMFRRPISIRVGQPLISFTFDDFPRTALLTGGEILKRHGVSGTYYTALGLLGEDSPSGPLFIADDLRRALGDGHELGCHTFSHDDAWHTDSKAFEGSIVQNQKALEEIAPWATPFKSFSYPISSPRPMVKRAAGRHFQCCRGGGQKINMDTADLNQLSAYFLEKAEGSVETIQRLIDQNTEKSGWIIFATHDVSQSPSPYGCTPDLFESVVRYSLEAGAKVLPVISALQAIRDGGTAT
jgi:peptidoglycan/xylan/chitin deacetylase (PgdA/CDA1 family)